MACNDCFNGCVQTTSDQCVKYTGNDISAWDIEKGDPLSEVISKLKTYLDGVASGDEILPDIATPCVDIPVGTGTLNEILDSIIDLVCELKDLMDEINDYTFTNVSCVTDVSPLPTDLLPIVNAILAHICTINGWIQDIENDIDALQNGMSQYVAIADVGTYVATYLNGLPEAGKYYTRMVPYVAEKYYGTPNFNTGGVGLGSFQYIYLCNGYNGTPDLRPEYEGNDFYYIMHVPPGGLISE